MTLGRVGKTKGVNEIEENSATVDDPERVLSTSV
jgi:hypothetical protein